ncbi:MAG TPA: RNA polymerase subunit sigma [Planctomycetaceae bacterium]|nr:RNA polymerase subunit sigma [Planctomycetaceae bacterium]
MENQPSNESNVGAITQALHAAGEGDLDARERVAELVYEDLKRTATYLMRNDRLGTLQPSALVNEAFLQLLDSDHINNAPCRAYFFAAAAKAMSRILVDASRKRNAAKRGGNQERVPLEHALASYQARSIDLIALDDALEELEELSQRQSQVVRLRFFLDFSVKEVAGLLDVSVSTVEQDWRFARAFLRDRVGVFENRVH